MTSDEPPRSGDDPRDPPGYGPPPQYGPPPYGSPGYGPPPQYGQYGQFGQYGPGADQPPAGLPYGQPYPGQYPGAGGAVDPATDPLLFASFGGYVRRVGEVVVRSGKPLVLINVAAALLAAFLVFVLAAGTGGAAIVAGDPAAAGAAAAGVLLGTMIAVVIIMAANLMAFHVALRDAAGGPSALGPAASFAAGRALPLFGWLVLVGVVGTAVLGVLLVLVFVAGAADPLVAVLLAIPAVLAVVYVMVVLTPTFVAVVALEHRGLGRMFALAHRSFWPNAGRVVAYLLVSAVYSGLVGLGIEAVSDDGTLLNGLLDAVLVQLPVSVVGVGVSLVTYAALRHHENPAVGTSTLAGELTR